MDRIVKTYSIRSMHCPAISIKVHYCQKMIFFLVMFDRGTSDAEIMVILLRFMILI
jgi:hypothetical protein